MKCSPVVCLLVLCSTFGAFGLSASAFAQSSMAVGAQAVTPEALSAATGDGESAPAAHKKKHLQRAVDSTADAPPPPTAADDRETVIVRKKSHHASAIASSEPAEPATREAPSETHTKHHKIATHAKHESPGHRIREPDPDYCRLRDSWHAPVAAPVEPEAVLDDHGRPPLVIVPVNGGEQVTLTPSRDDGGFDEAELKRASRVFTPPGTAKPHAVSPHLLDLVYQAMRHFAAPLVRLVSGYRRDRAGSRHTQGRAIDMVIPGVSNEQLVDYVREFGFCGVGIYPKSGFVHLDVRESSFFWVDESLPDERSRGVPILGNTAEAIDEAARQRGEEPQTFVPNNDREDRAAAHSYARRAQRKAAAAARAKHE